MEPLLLIDTNYLCHRVYHALGDLTFGGASTAVVFGVLRDIVGLQSFFSTGRCIFAFDHGGMYSARRDILPGYKSSRRKRHAAECDTDRAARKNLQQQIRDLRTTYLPMAGFRNVFSEPGLEADDIIASIAQHVPITTEAIIVSSDQDLWQCITENVWCWNKGKKRGYSLGTFRKQWGLPPGRWAEVKAIAGCKTDDVPGVPGVGEKTAAKYLRGDLGKHTKAHGKIHASWDIVERNMEVVRLPFGGTPIYSLGTDEVTESKWLALADMLGMRSLRHTVPRAAKRKSRGRRRG